MLPSKEPNYIENVNPAMHFLTNQLRWTLLHEVLAESDEHFCGLRSGALTMPRSGRMRNNHVIQHARFCQLHMF